MKLEQEAIRFVEQLADIYFVRKDINLLLKQMRPDTSWLGTGAREISRNLLDAKQSLTKEFAEYGGSFDIISRELYSTQLSDTVCVVYGLICAVPEQILVNDQNLHLTAVCIKTSEGMKLAHCNISRPDGLQEASNYYASPQAYDDNKKLRITLENLIRNIPCGAHQCLNDPNLTLVSMSDSFLEMFGYTHEEIETRFDNKFINMIYPSDRAAMLRAVNEQFSTSNSLDLEYRVMSKDNGPIWILDKCKLLQDEYGNSSFYCVLIEITQRKYEQEQLRLSLERHSIILDQAADIIFEWDIVSDTLEFSSNWRKKFGYDPISSHISRRIPFSENIHPDDMYAFVKLMRDIAAGVSFSEAECRIRDITENFSWNRIRATSQFDQNGRSIKAVGIITDISAEKAERLALLEQAQKDALTGLYNKSAIKTMVEQRMLENSSAGLQAMLILDVDYFKQVNDTYGHLCGDVLLSDIAEILKRQFSSSDLIGRIGGDEFLVYMPMVTDEFAVKSKVDTLLSALKQVHPSPVAPSITCSIGAVILPHNDMEYFALYQAADLALYRRKSEGRNGVSFYNTTLCSSTLGDDDLTGGLAHSAVNDYIDSDQCSVVEEKLAQYTFQMLYRSIDVKTAVHNLLEIVGRAYGVSRVYIFENSEDNLCCNNTFEWCAPDVTPQIDNLKGIRYKEDLGGYLQNFNESGVFYCHDITALHPSLYNVLSPQGIRSMLQCAVLDRGQFKGYVGFDECRENCLWSKEQIRSLTLIANMLSVFLIKLRLEEQLEKQSNETT